MVAEMGQLLQRFKEGRFNDSRGRDAQKLIKDCMSRIKSIGDLFAKLSKGGAADIPDISVSKSVESMVAILKVFAKGDRATFQDFSSAWAKCRELAQDNDHFTATLVSKNAEVAGVFRQQGRAFSALCSRAFNQSYVGRGWFQTQVDIQASPQQGQGDHKDTCSNVSDTDPTPFVGNTGVSVFPENFAGMDRYEFKTVCCCMVEYATSALHLEPSMRVFLDIVPVRVENSLNGGVEVLS